MRNDQMNRRCSAIGLPDGACDVARAQAKAALTERRSDRKRDWYRIENSADGEASDLYIYSEIVSQEESDFCGMGVSASGFVAELQNLKGQTLNVHLNSPGGLVFDGIAIYNALRQHDAPVNIVVDGIAASIASVIAMAGDTVTMAPHSMLMIHDAFGLTVGNAADHEQQAMVLNKMSDNIASIYAERGDKRVDWRQMMLAETWISDQEAVDMGLADKIDTSLGAASNAFDLTQYRNAPLHMIPSSENGQRHTAFLAMNTLSRKTPVLDDPISDPQPLTETDPEQTFTNKTAPTIRDVEKALRDAGLSDKSAKSVLAKGWAGASGMDDADEAQPAPDPTPASSGMDERQTAFARELARSQEWERLYVPMLGLDPVATKG